MEVCPRGINIPGIFGLYNMYKGSTAANASFMFVYNYNALEESTRADKCIKCGLCGWGCGSCGFWSFCKGWYCYQR